MLCKNNFQTKCPIKPLIIGLSFFLLNSFIASAAVPSDVDPYKDGNLSVIKCIDKGGLDFDFFLMRPFIMTA